MNQYRQEDPGSQRRQDEEQRKIAAQDLADDLDEEELALRDQGGVELYEDEPADEQERRSD